MPTLKTPQNLVKWLKGHLHLLRQEQLDLPPSYEKTSAPIVDEYRERAKSLVKQHRNRDYWFFGTKGEPLVKDITVFAQGKQLPNKSKEYVYEILDEFQLLMEWIDFLVDNTGLKHASGAESCKVWDSPVKGGRYTSGEIKEIESLRFRLAREVLRGWKVITAVPELPFLYLAACVYETDPVDRNRKELLHKLDLFDKRFALLRAHYGWEGARDFIDSRPGEMNGLAKFRFLAGEVRRGSNVFRDTYPRERFMRGYNKSNAFVNELYDSILDTSYKEYP